MPNWMDHHARAARPDRAAEGLNVVAPLQRGFGCPARLARRSATGRTDAGALGGLLAISGGQQMQSLTGRAFRSARRCGAADRADGAAGAVAELATEPNLTGQVKYRTSACRSSASRLNVSREIKPLLDRSVAGPGRGVGRRACATIR